MATSDGLKRMNKLLEILDNPEKDFSVLHIAGTNGKGSTAVMMASVLEASGYSVGLYTSPHLENICERIQIWDGEHRMISESDWDRLAEKVDAAAESIEKEFGRLHYFERITAIAYLYYAEVNPDYIVLETGLGGRLDSTNTISKPLVTTFTQIGLDHTKELGNTIFKIIHEKAGIIKPGVPVVSQDNNITVQQILSKVAAENGCEFVDVSAQRSKFKNYQLGMKGMYQVDNAATAVLSIRAAGIGLTEKAVEDGLKNAVIPGRFEMIGENPLWILDGAHNPDAMQSALDTFNFVCRNKKIKKKLVVFGCMQDKNYQSMIQLINRNTHACDIVTVSVNDDRGADPETLAGVFIRAGHDCSVCNDAEAVLDYVRTGDYECVLIIGSIYLAGTMRKLIQLQEGECGYVR